ncbi:MAG: hypothetical protein ABSC77_11135 [Terracidiphilus sp.]
MWVGLASDARGFTGQLLEILKQGQESFVEVAVAGLLRVANSDLLEQGPEQKVGLAVIDKEPEGGRSGARVGYLEFQNQVGIGRITRHFKETGGPESRK